MRSSVLYHERLFAVSQLQPLCWILWTNSVHSADGLVSQGNLLPLLSFLYHLSLAIVKEKKMLLENKNKYIYLVLL